MTMNVFVNDYVVNDNKNSKQCASADSIEKELSLAGINNPVEYAISVINKTVKCDDSLVRACLLCWMQHLDL